MHWMPTKDFEIGAVHTGSTRKLVEIVKLRCPAEASGVHLSCRE
jgi:hypothetical protein